MLRNIFIFLVLLLGAGAASAQTITLVQSNSATVSAQTQNVAISSSVGAGDLVVVWTHWGGVAGDSTTISDDHSNSYTQLTCNSTQGNILRGFWAVNASAQTSLTVTAAFGGGVNHTIRQVVFEYSSTTGWQGTPIDVCNSNFSATGTIAGDTGLITPAAAGELGVGAIEFSVAVSAIAVTSPYVKQDGTGTGWGSTLRVDSCDNTSVSSGSQNCAFTWTTSSAWGAVIATFKPAAAGGATSKQLSLTGVGTLLFRNLFWSVR